MRLPNKGDRKLQICHTMCGYEITKETKTTAAKICIPVGMIPFMAARSPCVAVPIDINTPGTSTIAKTMCLSLAPRSLRRTPSRLDSHVSPSHARAPMSLGSTVLNTRPSRSFTAGKSLLNPKN
jgi:hypothetical protein